MRQTTNSQSEDLFSKSMNKVERFGVFELILEGKIPVGSHIEVDCSAVFMKGDRKSASRVFTMQTGNTEYVSCLMISAFGGTRFCLHLLT